MKWTKRLGKCLGVGAVLTALSTGGAGCLSRPVGQQPPTTKVNFTSNVSQQAVDKVDLLFAIDNSASMGDKQTILSEAVPVLLDGLLTPKCINPTTEKPVDANGNDLPTVTSPGIARAKADGNKGNRYGCPGTSEPEFKPVSDMHIGIVSSSLGNFGAGDKDPSDYVCPPSGTRMNDRAHLLKAKKDGSPVPEAGSGNFLAWFPTNEENQDKKRHPDPATPTKDLDQLKTAFKDLVVGVDQTGCGLEAQLESFYHFLIQPDPWVSVKLDANNQADFGDEVDVELLQQRADFLRPDSLVAVIMLTDEDDSSSDPYSVGGQGWAFMARKFPGSKVFRQESASGTTAPRGTTVCSTNPGSADCTSCGFQSLCNQSEASCQKIRNDANCKESPEPGSSGDGYNGYYGKTDDNLNVRFHRMKERYGIDPQYPIRRYVDGLTKTRVPDRKSEHTVRVVGGTRREISGYTPTPKCTNPLFAKQLPRNPGDELCNLQRSTRSPDLIFFAVVGGVPNELLHFDPNDAEKSRIVEADWVKILGRDPANFDYTGIDPHMIQSVGPRAGLEPPNATRGENGSDPYHGREWDTQKDDLQYACTFDLPTELQRVCEGASATSCDCDNVAKNPPLCDKTEAKRQIKAKAYPTIREFQVVRALGEQGVISSLCPLQLTGEKSDPRYGYNPAVSAIIDRLKNALTTQCLPQRLRDKTAAKDAPVSCLILAQLAEPGDQCPPGTKAPDPEILKVFLEQQKAESGNTDGPGTVDLTKLPVCEVQQRAVAEGQTCRNDTDIAWCYVEGVSRKCPQEIHFTTGTQTMVGARFSLQCINQFSVSDSEKQQ